MVEPIDDENARIRSGFKFIKLFYSFYIRFKVVI